MGIDETNAMCIMSAMDMQQLLETIWPRNADLASDMSVPYPTAQSWKLRGFFPAERDFDLVACAGRRGHEVTLEQVAQARRATHERRAERKSRNIRVAS
ncbi:MAG: hypothetical protein KA139_08585 [Rhodobacteraceae bacterium]|nr:hypothetical protein [Paracoccaceae bacterium]